MVDRRAVVRQIVPKYVRAYNDSGDKWQIRFPGEPMIESVHLGNTEEQVRENVERILQVLEKRAETELEMRSRYNNVSTPLHIFGDWHSTNAYDAVIALASSEDQPLRTSFGTIEERNDALAALKTAKYLVVDLVYHVGDKPGQDLKKSEPTLTVDRSRKRRRRQYWECNQGLRRTATNIGILRARRSLALPSGICDSVKGYASPD